MKLTRLRVEQFRRFRQPFELRDLAPGLNLFTGANEAGKSTLVAAIRAAFFERHRSGTVDHLRPWDDPAASPEIELDFELDGRPCRLSKRFLGRRRCTLQYGERVLDGAEAEDFIAGRLGFTHALRGASKADDWGIPGLLWVEQGSAQALREAVAHATDHLRTALTASLGEIAGGDGDDITAEVEALRNELLTPASDKPRGAWLEAMQQVAKLDEALAAIDADLLASRQKVDRLAQLRSDHDADESGLPWQTLRAQAAEARAALGEARSLQARLAGEREALGAQDQRIALLRQQLDTLAAEARSADERAVAVSEAQQADDDAQSLAAPWRQREREAQQRHDAARLTLAAARARDTRDALVRELEELRAKAAAADKALARADAEQTRLLALQSEAAASEIRPPDLAALREQSRRLRELDIRRAAVATRLRYALESGRELHIGNETLTGDGERQLLDATTLVLPGHGRLRIEPGGSDTAALAREAAELRDRHDGALVRLGLASLEAAEARQQVHAQKLSELTACAATLKVLAPQGVDALRNARAAMDGRIAELAQRLAALQCDDRAELPPVALAEAEEEAARLSVAEAARRLSDARSRCAATEAALAAARRELVAARSRIDDPAWAQQRAQANAALTDAGAQRAVLVERMGELQRQLERARPDALEQDVQRFERSAEVLERAHALRRDELTRLEVELQAAGARGLDERRAGLARDRAAAARRLDQLARRARALSLLLECLRDKRHALTQRLQAPLQQHLNHYLGLLLPGARVTLDDSLSPGPITRDGGDQGRVDELSFGAREQMGVIARLACADLLQAAGRPTLVILDDVLVHSDAARRARMKSVLFDAAQRHQILLFTCHPENWRDLGVPARLIDAG